MIFQKTSIGIVQPQDLSPGHTPKMSMDGYEVEWRSITGGSGKVGSILRKYQRLAIEEVPNNHWGDLICDPQNWGYGT